jgi:sulfide dehydrogenase [flavocytochrome c] flavoprotein subunit
MTDFTRRDIAALIGGAMAAPTIAGSANAAAAPRVVVIGGGFAGATFCKYLRRAHSTVQITMVEPKTTYTSCVYSNETTVGLNTLKSLTFNYDKLVAKYGVTHKVASVTSIDPVAKTVQLDDATSLSYDKLVMAPGMVYRLDAIVGFDETAAKKWPVAWHAGPETKKLYQNLTRMKQGGTAIVTVPPMPYRCPPAPYERASLFAWYLTQNNPGARVLLLDSNDTFAMQDLFEEGWNNLYPAGTVTRISGPNGGQVTSVDTSAMTVTCGAGTFDGDLINIIPPQKSGPLAEATGLTDSTLWCPVDPTTFASTLVPDIHVIGDSAASGLPKSATSGNAGAKIAALAMAETFLGHAVTDPVFINNCYARMLPEYAIGILDVFGVDGTGHVAIRYDGKGETPLGASLKYHAQEKALADKWFKSLTSDTFA